MHLPLFAAGEWLIILPALPALAASAHALLSKREPVSAFVWILLCWLLPLAGALLYVLFGINRVRARARELRPRGAAARAPPGRGPKGDLEAQITHVGDAVTQWPRIAGNCIDLLENGENAFPPMLAAIAAAQHTVWLGTYLFQTDAVGRHFIKALADATARGVQVRVLVDGIGEFYSWPLAVRELRRAGVRAARFMPPRLLPPMLALNLRNHRKLLLVDGHTGFLGGMNIGGREVGKPRQRRMADLHFRVQGPVVAQLAQCFGIDWQFCEHEALAMPAPAPAAGPGTCRVITDGPDEDNDKLLFVILGAISAARHRVLVMTPYFVPPATLTAALQAAALRGVEVCLVLPERSNLHYVDWATRRWLPPLLERGVRIYLQPPPFAHTKLLVVDDTYAQIGSANLDSRSLRLNFEVALETYDPAVCRQLAHYVIGAYAHSHALTAATAATAAGETLLARIRNSLAWLLSPYL